MDFLNELKECFELLKKEVYYDKNLRLLKKIIISFDYEEKMIELNKKLSLFFKDEFYKENIDGIFKEYLDNIDFNIFPKSIYDNKDNENKMQDGKTEYSNDQDKIIHSINDFQFFINMPIELHLLGVLWIKKCGYLLDKKMLENSYGNRIAHKSLQNKRKIFIPYFSKYESWQKSAYTEAINLLNNKKNCMIYTFDITRFYYSIDFNDKLYNSIQSELKYECDTTAVYSRLTLLLKKISMIYSDKIGKFITKMNMEIKTSAALIPIGFFPSSIIANYVLNKFDRIIQSELSPNFYGRYVDDIIIVKEIKDYENKDDYGLKIFENKDILLNKGNEIKIKQDLVFDSNLVIKKEKTSIGYFSYEYRHDSLDQIVKYLYKNEMRFEYLSDEEVDFKINPLDVFSYNGKITKFNQLYEGNVDRYKFSVMMAKYKIYISKIGIENQEDNLKELLRLLTPKVLFNNYQTLDKLFYIFLASYKINKKLIIYFVEKVFNIFKTKDYGFTKEIQESFFEYAKVCLVSSSVCFCGDVEQLFSKINNVIGNFDLEKERIKYVEYGCFDKLIMPVYVPIVDGFIGTYKMYSSKKFESLYEFETICNILRKIDNDSKEDKLPNEKIFEIYVKAFEKKLAEITNVVVRDLFVEEEVCGIIKINDKYDENKYIDIHDNCLHEVNVGISNIQEYYDVYDAFKCTKNRSTDRFLKISKIINETISNKCDIIVFPEACIPLEWMTYFINICMKKNIAMVTGIEPIITNGKYYNFTSACLPRKTENYQNMLIAFHLKKYYSPLEIKLCKYYSLKEQIGHVNFLINYNNFYFKFMCCYEYAILEERIIYHDYVDAVIIVEYNKDVNYFSNITESYSRDLHCYVIQVNNSIFGDSRITQPTKTESMNLIKVKGGKNATILVDKIDIQKLRTFQLLPLELQMEDKSYKTTPSNFDRTKVIIRNNDGNPLEDNL